MVSVRGGPHCIREQSDVGISAARPASLRKLLILKVIANLAREERTLRFSGKESGEQLRRECKVAIPVAALKLQVEQTLSRDVGSRFQSTGVQWHPVQSSAVGFHVGL